MAPSFDSADDELRFLRSALAVHRMADEIVEDCVLRQLGLEAAADVFLSQCARMLGASQGFLQVLGTSGPVLTRSFGAELHVPSEWPSIWGSAALDESRTAFVAPLDLGSILLGSMGFVLRGRFQDGGTQVQSLVEIMAEVFDTALLSFVALVDGRPPLQLLDELSAETDFAPRSRIGKYELLHPLGSGGMAQVMVARSLGPEGVSRLVAIKRILPNLARVDTMVQQFLDEAQLSMRFAHPNLMTVYDFGRVGSMHYLAMELIRGVDFDRFLEATSRPPPPSFVTAIAVQALAGLHAAHELRDEGGRLLEIVHRDLSPHNLMIGFDGRVKLVDFGVAKSRRPRVKTAPGLVKGKPIYMSPEQASDEGVDRRSDLFSMGLVLYEALTGERAFDRGQETASMLAIVNDPLPRHEAIPQPLWAVIERALSKNVERRYPTALAMSEALARAVPPMAEADVGGIVKAQFPRRFAELGRWEREALTRPLAGEGDTAVKAQ